MALGGYINEDGKRRRVAIPAAAIACVFEGDDGKAVVHLLNGEILNIANADFDAVARSI